MREAYRGDESVDALSYLYSISFIRSPGSGAKVAIRTNPLMCVLLTTETLNAGAIAGIAVASVLVFVFLLISVALCVVIFNPRRACAARVTVIVLSVCQSVSVSVHDYSRTAGNEAASERYQQLQRNKRSKTKKAILLKRRRSRSRNWHYRGPRCVTQPIN